MKTLVTGAALALMVSGSALAAEMNWADWDSNADSQLDQNEFTAGLDADGAYDAWDGDRDGMLSRDEFNEGMFSTLDSNQDKILNEPEGVTLDAMRTGWEVDR